MLLMLTCQMTMCMQLVPDHVPVIFTCLGHGFDKRLPYIVQHLLDILHVCTVGFVFRDCHVDALEQLWYSLHSSLPDLLMEVEFQQGYHDLCDLHSAHPDFEST